MMIRPGSAWETVMPWVDRSRQEHQRPGPARHLTFPAESLELAVHDEECSVLRLVNVRRRGEAGRHPVIDDAQLALAIVAADVVDRRGVREPGRLPFVGCRHEAADPGQR